MTDTNKERAEFEAWYASQPDATNEPERSYELDEAGMNELTKDCIWEGWKARAAKAPAAEPVACNVNGTWLWIKLMDWCKKRGSAPADYSDLFLIAREARALYTAPPAPTEQWRGIETAPKDGIWQDGNNHYAEYILVWYPGALRPMRARWWFRDDSEACNFLADGGYAVFPTMYQPLPAPPQGAAKGDGNG